MRANLFRLWKYLLPYWKQSTALTAALLLNTSLGLVSPYLTRPLTDKVLVPSGGPLPLDARLKWLGLIVVSMLLCQAASQVVTIVQGRISAGLTHNLGHSRALLLKRLSVGFAVSSEE